MGGLGPHDGFQLRIFGVYVKQGFGHTAYHVGSSLTKKKPYRDVDVRLLLPDDEFETFLGNPLKASWLSNKKAMWEFAWTTLGKKITGLPIDFQIQQQTLANENFKGPRSALLILDSDFPVVRTRKDAS